MFLPPLGSVRDDAAANLLRRLRIRTLLGLVTVAAIPILRIRLASCDALEELLQALVPVALFLGA